MPFCFVHFTALSGALMTVWFYARKKNGEEFLDKNISEPFALFYFLYVKPVHFKQGWNVKVHVLEIKVATIFSHSVETVSIIVFTWEMTCTCKAVSWSFNHSKHFSTTFQYSPIHSHSYTDGKGCHGKCPSK